MQFQRIFKATSNVLITSNGNKTNNLYVYFYFKYTHNNTQKEKKKYSWDKSAIKNTMFTKLLLKTVKDP